VRIALAQKMKQRTRSCAPASALARLLLREGTRDETPHAMLSGICHTFARCCADRQVADGQVGAPSSLLITLTFTLGIPSLTGASFLARREPGE
jgi:hypothetical protein